MKVRHPDFPDLVREVGDGKSWLAAGWIPVDAKPAAKKAAKKAPAPK